MTISMYKTSVPIFVQFLTSMSAVLDKAAAHCEAKKIEPATLLNMRLYPDMFPLMRQLRAVTDHAISGTARLAGAELIIFPNNEASFAEIKDRIAKTIDFVTGADRRHRGEGDRCQVLERRAQVQRTGVPAKLLFAEFLFPRHHRLRHPAPLRDRARQARFHGNAGSTLG